MIKQTFKTYIVPNYEIQDVKLNDSLKAHLLTASKMLLKILINKNSTNGKTYLI